MGSKRTIEYFCEDCHAEYMITWDEDNLLDNPLYCPFCAYMEDELEYDEDSGEI